MTQYFVVVGSPKSYIILDDYDTPEDAVENCPEGGFIVEVWLNVGRKAGEG